MLLSSIFKVWVFWEIWVVYEIWECLEWCGVCWVGLYLLSDCGVLRLQVFGGLCVCFCQSVGFLVFVVVCFFLGYMCVCGVICVGVCSWLVVWGCVVYVFKCVCDFVLVVCGFLGLYIGLVQSVCVCECLCVYKRVCVGSRVYLVIVRVQGEMFVRFQLLVFRIQRLWDKLGLGRFYRFSFVVCGMQVVRNVGGFVVGGVV